MTSSTGPNNTRTVELADGRRIAYRSDGERRLLEQVKKLQVSLEEQRRAPRTRR